MSNVKSSTNKILQQTSIFLDWNSRQEHLIRLYNRMFPNLQVPLYNSVEKYRGWEGAMVRGMYKDIAMENGIEWTSRSSAPKDLQVTINYCNGCLYALVEAVTLSCGLHSSLGIAHQGDQRSLAYDIADTVKFNWFLPKVFSFYCGGVIDPFKDSRKFCRDIFMNSNLTKQLFDNVKYIFKI